MMQSTQLNSTQFLFEKKRELAQTITCAIENFEQETGFLVTAISLDSELVVWPGQRIASRLHAPILPEQITLELHQSFLEGCLQKSSEKERFSTQGDTIHAKNQVY